MLFGLFQAFDSVERSYKSYFFLRKKPTFPNANATCSELPSNKSAMHRTLDAKMFSMQCLKVADSAWRQTNVLFIYFRVIQYSRVHEKTDGKGG